MNKIPFKKFINLKAPILITGETGSGKSHVARKIFENSKIHKEKFITAHLASLKEDLLESELFGHKKGSFTGAFEVKHGYLKEVGSGTLFLDEVGELSLESQKKLLYLLEEKKFTPLGATESLDFNGRIILATNQNLKKLVSEGKFREDLYYRMSMFEMKMPSLRERPESLRETIEEIFSYLKIKYERPHYFLTECSFLFLLNQQWKGNYRELKNALEFAIVMADERRVTPENFPLNAIEDLSEMRSLEYSWLTHFPEDFNQSLEQFEKMYLQSILEKNAGRVNETARRLGMSKTTLIQKAKKYQINTLKMRADASVFAA